MGQSKVRKKLGLPRRTQKPAPASQPPQVFEKLPNFNTDQLAHQAIASLENKVFKECVHLRESRKDPHSDFHGYMTKVQAEGSDGIRYFILKTCSECAPQEKAAASERVKIVARINYGMLSDHTLKAMHKNPGPNRQMVPVSDLGKKLAAEAEAEGPDAVN